MQCSTELQSFHTVGTMADAKSEAKGTNGDSDVKGYKGGGAYAGGWSDDEGESKAEAKESGDGDGSAFDARCSAWPGGSCFTPTCRSGCFTRGISLMCCEPPKWRGQEWTCEPGDIPREVETGQELVACLAVKRNPDIDDDHTAVCSFDGDDGILWLADGNVSAQHGNIELKATCLGGGSGTAEWTIMDSSSNGTTLLACASDSGRWLELGMEKHTEYSLLGASYVRFGLSMVFAICPVEADDLGFGPSDAWEERNGDGAQTEVQLKELGYDEVDQEAYRDMPRYF